VTSSAADQQSVRKTIDAIFRIESAKLIAGLTRMVRDVGLAEELAQDAMVSAIETWPKTGIPDNPGAWLMTAAKNRGLDSLRRKKWLGKKHEAMTGEAEAEMVIKGTPDLEKMIDEKSAVGGDDLLRLVFIACHPVLSTEARVALTLRLLGGLTTEEIARAFLVSEPTIAQRIVRAKRTLSEAKVEFEVPRGEQLHARLASVLEVVYLIFNEGYAATAGDDWMRPALCEDAMRLGRILAGLVPEEPEVHALVALMELNQSRAAARTGPNGEPILLADQNRAKWDRLLIQRGVAALTRAQELPKQKQGFYELQAAAVACHARARTVEETDFARIAEIYGALVDLTRSPVIELNRAVAVGMAEGPEAALAIVDDLISDGVLTDYHLLPSVRGDLLWKLHRYPEAREEFLRAAELTKNARERDLLLDRSRACVVKMNPH
jgi:RNA polymerase sigma-70 factor, ECF subfamily